MIDWVLIGLATWYVSYAVTSTHGPGNVFEWIRENVWHGRTRIMTQISTDPSLTKYEQQKNGLMDCPICLSFWVALILLLVPMGVVVQALALAGAAMLAHGLAGYRFGNG